jgi:hypothetical protein
LKFQSGLSGLVEGLKSERFPFFPQKRRKKIQDFADAAEIRHL